MKLKFIFVGLFLGFISTFINSQTLTVQEISERLRTNVKYNFTVNYSDSVAIAASIISDNTCLVLMNPIIKELKSDTIAFIIAHELNHCLEAFNTPKMNINQEKDLMRIYRMLSKEAKHNMEYRSDLFAADLLCETGFDSKAGWHEFFTLVNIPETKSHPSSENRIKMLGSTIEVKSKTGYYPQMLSLTPRAACK